PPPVPPAPVPVVPPLLPVVSPGHPPRIRHRDAHVKRATLRIMVTLLRVGRLSGLEAACLSPLPGRHGLRAWSRRSSREKVAQGAGWAASHAEASAACCR